MTSTQAKIHQFTAYLIAVHTDLGIEFAEITELHRELFGRQTDHYSFHLDSFLFRHKIHRIFYSMAKNDLISFLRAFIKRATKNPDFCTKIA